MVVKKELVSPTCSVNTLNPWVPAKMKPSPLMTKYNIAKNAIVIPDHWQKIAYQPHLRPNVCLIHTYTPSFDHFLTVPISAAAIATGKK